MSDVSLKEHIEGRLDEQDRRIYERFELLASELVLARREMDQKIHQLNQLRNEVNQDRGQFVDMKVYQIWHDMVEKRLTTVETRIVTWISAVGFFFLAIQIVLRFVK